MAARSPDLRARYVRALALSLVVAFGAGLRFRELGEVSVWLDEAITWQRARLPVSELIADCLQRNHTPTYFLMMHAWLQLGDSELMLRLPSALFGTLRLAAVCALGMVVGGLRVGVLAGLLVALMPQQLRYDQEARMYALLCLATTLALCGLLWLLRHPDERGRPILALVRRRSAPRGDAGPPPSRPTVVAWLALVTGTALALYSHNTAVLFVAVTWVMALVGWCVQAGEGPRGRAGFARNWLFAQALVLLSWAPWLGSFSQQAGHVRERFWARFPTPQKIWATLSDLYLFGGDEPWLVALVLVLAACGTWALRRRPVVLAALWLPVVLTPALVLAVSLERPMFLLRIMLWSAVPLAVVLASSARLFAHVGWSLLLCGLVVGAGLLNLERHYYGAGRKADWRAALTDIAEHRKASSLVLLAGGREIRQVRYYLERKTRPLPALPYVNVVTREAPDAALARARRTRDVWVIHRKTRARTHRVLRDLRRYGRQRARRYYGHHLTVRRFRMRKATP